MNSKAVASLFWALIIIQSAGMASARFTMEMTLQPKPIIDGNGTMSIALTNSGDEAAYRGTVQVVYPKELTSQPIFFDKLEPGIRNLGDTVIHDTKGMPHGTYPLVASLQFHDNNNYPIYMVFDSSVVVGTPSTSNIFGTLTSTEFPLDGSGTLTLTMKNADEVAHTVRTKLIAPESVSVDKAEGTVEIQPRSQATVEYSVSNFMALPDSDFSVVAVMEYDDSTHHTSYAKGRIKMGTQSERPAWVFPAAAAAVLFGAAAAYAYFRRAGND